jgi:hypothetical protein
MRVEYTRPSADEPEPSIDSPGNGHVPAGRKPESSPGPEDEQPGGDSRPTVG